MVDSRKTFRVLSTILTGLACSWLCATALAQSDSFQLPSGCKLPFENIATKPDPYVQCGNCGAVERPQPGRPSDAKAKALQSQAKNNLCADVSQVMTADFATLQQMGSTAKTNGWETIDLDGRGPLHGFYEVNGKKIGEGDVVRLKAWILKAHVSDCTSSETGEAVNCNVQGFANNDLHVPLLDPSGDRTQDECASITAEIIPHFRPATWANLDLKTPVKNVVRITGQLFYDNAHVPCNQPFSKTAPANAKTRPPYRSTLWEIHPVYQLEVCSNTDPAKCDVNSSDTTMWVDYDKWIAKASNASATQPTGQQQRRGCPAAKPNPNVEANKCVADSTAYLRNE